MNAKELRGKAAKELNEELLKLRREQFSLRMQRATGQTVKPNDFGRVRKDIARLKTVLAEQAAAASKASGK
ncbi:MAG: 50S ribosomal protein L29 [Steroidobacteraceae bacterium]|jgi:large subunit ribosomal protein L29